MSELVQLIIKLSNNYTDVITREEIMKYKEINWSGNGIGDRWCRKKFNYSVIYKNGKVKTYSENENDKLENEKIQNLLENCVNIKSGIIGIFVHSIRTNIQKRPIKKEILEKIKSNCCVSCGSYTDIICDHKNDMYNDDNVLNTKQQDINDFQALCNHCNLQKRQVFKTECNNKKIYSAKQLKKYEMYKFDFPWEYKAFDKNNIETKKDTYWYDPVEFNNKIYLYMICTLPIITEIKNKIKSGKIKVM